MSIILHIPHDSTDIPEAYAHDFCLSDDELEYEIIQMTDMHTKELYEYSGCESVVFPVSRLLCDPERFDDDEQEVMAARGMGVIYSVTSELKPLKHDGHVSNRQKILDEYYYPHHNKLESAVSKYLGEKGQCLIVDCHSFPSRPLKYELKTDHELRSEIVIGTDDFHTPTEITDALFNFFQEKGYSVAINDPFAGALVPMKFYRKDKSVMSVMYEIRRDLYMDEETAQKSADFSNIQDDINESIRLLEGVVSNL